MKWYWKVVIGIVSLVLLLVILNIGLNIWVNRQLPKIINRENDSAYYITYKNLNVSLSSSNITAEGIVIVPKIALKDSINKVGVYAKVRHLEVKGFSTWDLIFNDKLKAKSISVKHPKVILYSKSQKENIRKSVVQPFEKIITVSDVFVHHGDLKILSTKNDKAVFSASNINLNLDGIVVNDKILKDKIPFEFSNYTFDCDSIYYHPNDFYNIKTHQVKISKSALKINKFQMLPRYSRLEHVSKMTKEKDIFTLLCDTIRIDKMDWGFKNDDFYFHCHTINLEHASANIFRSKEPADDLSKKHLYNKLLRELKFDLKVDTLKIRNSILEYEEEKSNEFGAGKLVFNSFNLTATSINSGFKKTALPDLDIKIDCRFMNHSPFHVNWKFNVMDITDGFHINGRLTNFEAEKIIPFSKPYLNVTTKGTLEEVRFNFAGNDKGSQGDFKIEYDDLKFTVYKKNDRKKKNKLLTFVAKIFVKKDTNDKLKEAHIAIERIPEKSFYNLLWRSVQEGLKKLLV